MPVEKIDIPVDVLLDGLILDYPGDSSFKRIKAELIDTRERLIKAEVDLSWQKAETCANVRLNEALSSEIARLKEALKAMYNNGVQPNGWKALSEMARKALTPK